MYQTIINSVKPKMSEVIDKFQHELSNLRTGKANASLVEDLKVEYYGVSTPLKQMASLTTPDTKTIAIMPWDKNNLGDIELAIRNSGLGLNPINDGNVIRINLPPLTEERRKELVKIVGTIAEEAKITLRNIRGEVWNQIKEAEKSAQITQDDRYRAEEELNKIIDEFNRKIQEFSDKKEEELMKI